MNRWLEGTAFFCLCVGVAGAAVQAQADAFAYGADISWVTQMEASNVLFYNSAGSQEDCFKLMSDLCINAIRLRVWVNPTGGWCDTTDMVSKAVRAQAQGQLVLVDIHYSDTWADPGDQNLPAAWAGDALPQLVTQVGTYTTSVMTALQTAGVTPTWVQVGNETNNGMMWPLGQVAVGGVNNFTGFSELINAGYAAVKAVFPAAKVIIHLSNGYDNGLFEWMFDGLKAAGTNWDIVGMSMYPSDYATTSTWQTYDAECLANMDDMVSRYGKQVMIVEAGMPETPAATSESFLQDLITKTKSVAGGSGLGVFYWEPECYNNWQGYSMGAFDNTGKPTVAMDAFGVGCSVGTNTSTKTATPSPTATLTPSPKRTVTLSGTPSATLTASPKDTLSVTASPTPSVSGTLTFSATRTTTPGDTVTATVTSSLTANGTPTESETPTMTPTDASIATATLSGTVTGTPIISGTWTATPVDTSSATATPSVTPTPSGSWTATSVDTPGATDTAPDSPTTSATTSATTTRNPSATSSATAASTLTFSTTDTPNATVGSSHTATLTMTLSASSTATFSASYTATATSTPSAEATGTPSVTPAVTPRGTPALDSIVPTSVAVGTAMDLTLTGSGFIMGDWVVVNGVKLEPLSLTPEQIVVALPAQAMVGPLDVTVEGAAGSSNAETLTVKASVTDTPVAEGPLVVTALDPVPNPNPIELAVDLAGPAESVVIRVYTKALTLAFGFSVPGLATGWHSIDLPPTWGELPDGMYYVQAQALHGGTVSKPVFAKVMVLK
ncbi:MAG: glycosyl hydrolase 53 family protein [bacterium]